jgi:hypothetical protein
MDTSEATSGERKPLSINDLGAPRARKALPFNDLRLARFLPAITRAGTGPGTLFDVFTAT